MYSRFCYKRFNIKQMPRRVLEFPWISEVPSYPQGASINYVDRRGGGGQPNVYALRRGSGSKIGKILPTQFMDGPLVGFSMQLCSYLPFSLRDLCLQIKKKYWYAYATMQWTILNCQYRYFKEEYEYYREGVHDQEVHLGLGVREHGVEKL